VVQLQQNLGSSASAFLRRNYVSLVLLPGQRPTVVEQTKEATSVGNGEQEQQHDLEQKFELEKAAAAEKLKLLQEKRKSATRSNNEILPQQQQLQGVQKEEKLPPLQQRQNRSSSPESLPPLQSGSSAPSLAPSSSSTATTIGAQSGQFILLRQLFRIVLHAN
jgi:hypothetical protein